MNKINPKLIYYIIECFRDIILVLFTMQVILYLLDYIQKDILFYINTIGLVILFMLLNGSKQIYYNNNFGGKNE